MTTALDIITDAMLNVGIGSIGDGVEDGVAQFALRRLNRMIQSWTNENLLVFNAYVDQIALTPGVATYSSTLLTNGRPTNIDDCIVRLSSIDYPVDLINNQDYNDIPFKATAGLPDRVYADQGFPNTTFSFYPTPSAAYTAIFNLRGPLSATMTLATTLSLPPGYEEAIVDNLAVLLGPPFKRQADQVLTSRANEGKAWLKVQNFVPLQMSTNLPTHRRLYNIQRGY